MPPRLRSLSFFPWSEKYDLPKHLGPLFRAAVSKPFEEAPD